MKLATALPGFTRSFSLRACGPDDPDASRAAAALGAYFDLEQARACRRLVWRAVAVGGLAGWALAVATSALTPVDVVFGVGLLGAAAVASAVAEWRAQRNLGILLR
jgi:hypothetical protein